MEQGKCDGRCETCNINQRTYCTSQRIYFAMQEISEIKAALAHLADRGENSVILMNDKNSSESEPVTSGADV